MLSLILCIICALASMTLSLNFLRGNDLCVALIVCTFVYGIWLVVVVTAIKDMLTEQLKDLNSIAKIQADKESYKSQLEEYKLAMGKTLVEEYKTFEEKIMESVRDSKIVATILKQSNYANVLSRYEGTVKDLIKEINNCDRRISSNIKDMKVRQAKNIFNYSYFLPGGYRYVEQYHPHNCVMDA